MALLKGNHEETFTIDVPLEKAKAVFGGLDTIIKNYGNLEKGEKLDDKTIHFVLEPRSAMGATFQGDYQCEYNFTSETKLEWHSVGSGNMQARGAIEFKALDDKKTQLVYHQDLTLDMPVNRLLAKALSPIVARNIRTGIREYLERMKKEALSASD